MSLAVSALPFLAHGKTVREVAEDFMEDRWSVNDGLPGNQALSVTQSSDGYIWVSTYYALARFDGLKFTVFDASTPGLPPGICYQLLAGEAGSVWGRFERDVVHYADGHFKSVANFDEAPLHRLFLLTATRNRTLFALGIAVDRSTAWLFEFDRDGIRQRIPVSDITKYALSQFQGTTDQQGQIWFRFQDRLATLSNGQLQSVNEAGNITSGPTASRHGGIWLGRDQMIQRWQDGDWSSPPIQSPVEFSKANKIFETPKGDVWLMCPGGRMLTYRQRELADEWDLIHSFETVPRSDITMDFEGQFWITRTAPNKPDNSGIFHLRERVFRNTGEIEGLSKTVRSFVQLFPNTLYIGTASGVFPFPTDLKDLRGTNPSSMEKLSDGHCWTMAPASDRSLYLANFNFNEKQLTTGKQPIRRLSNLSSATIDAEYLQTHEESSRIVALTEAQDGAIWYADSLVPGVSQVQQGTVTHYGLDTFPTPSKVSSLVSDSQGQLWIGTRTRGLIRYAKGQFFHYTEEQGGIEAKVRALLLDEDETLWLATGGDGLLRFQDGQFHAFTTQQGLPTNEVTTLVDDRLGNLWLGSYNGIHRVAKQQLHDVAAGRANLVFARSFGLADGLSSLQCSSGHPSSICTTDGRLWFATVRGANFVDPTKVLPNPTAPKVILETLVLDGTPINLEPQALQGSETAFSTGVERIEFHFTASSFNDPEGIRFRYRLEPNQSEWSELGFNRSVVLPSLAQGNYVFRVTAANSDGVWNENGVSLVFHVKGQWWERTPIRAMIFFGIIGFGILVFVLRTRQLQRRQAAKEQFARELIDHQEADRKRIARELHDGLEQNLLIIKNQTAQIEAEESSVASKQLRSISDLSSEAIAEVRQIANNLRPYQIDRLGLTKAIRSMLDQLNEATDLTIEHEIEPVPPSIPSEFQINLYRILQEALNNTIKHAEATHVSVTLVVTERQISLRIKDNGQGFDPKLLEENVQHSFGISGIIERASIHGGHCELKSSPGFGTDWRVRLPLP